MCIFASQLEITVQLFPFFGKMSSLYFKPKNGVEEAKL